MRRGEHGSRQARAAYGLEVRRFHSFGEPMSCVDDELVEPVALPEIFATTIGIRNLLAVFGHGATAIIDLEGNVWLLGRGRCRYPSVFDLDAEARLPVVELVALRLDANDGSVVEVVGRLELRRTRWTDRWLVGSPAVASHDLGVEHDLHVRDRFAGETGGEPVRER